MMNWTGDVQLNKIKKRQRDTLEELLTNVFGVLCQENLIENLEIGINKTNRSGKGTDEKT